MDLPELGINSMAGCDCGKISFSDQHSVLYDPGEQLYGFPGVTQLLTY